MIAAHWTYTSNSTGYMLFKDGVPQGGAGTIDNDHAKRKRNWQHIRADVRIFAEAAKRECDKRNSGA
jgi:hypothetical protein